MPAEKPRVFLEMLYHEAAQEYLHDTRYMSVPPNESGRCPLRELELEVALLDGWVRYWLRGELLPLPADLLQQVNEFQRLWQNEKRRADAAEERARTAEEELARLRKLLDERP